MTQSDISKSSQTISHCHPLLSYNIYLLEEEQPKPGFVVPCSPNGVKFTFFTDEGGVDRWQKATSCLPAFQRPWHIDVHNYFVWQQKNMLIAEGWTVFFIIQTPYRTLHSTAAIHLTGDIDDKETQASEWWLQLTERSSLQKLNSPSLYVLFT